MCSKKDVIKHSDWMWRSISCFIAGFYCSLNMFGYITQSMILSTAPKSQVRKYMIISLAIPFTFSAIFSYIKNREMNKELDIKYTPLWLKSTGKLY